MASLGSLLGGLIQPRRRNYGMWNRGYGRSRSHWGRGYGRAQSSGVFGSPIGRMAMGGLAVWLARGFMNRRAIHD